MPGWNLTNGILKENKVCEEQYWALFNYVFSDGCKKRNTYKFGLIKSILDNLFNCECDNSSDTYFISYEDIFSKFTENYWNLVLKYHLKQMRKDGRTEISKIESIFQNAVNQNGIVQYLEYSSLSENEKKQITATVSRECRRNVIGALYNDFDGVLYAFDLKGSGLFINHCAYDFMMKYKVEIEKLNYYSWAKFMEGINDDEVLIKVLDKLELSTPRRADLSLYREILRTEFEESTCFYCGRKLKIGVHVDHFIPWSFVKDDKLWNFVLSCPTCNERKNNKIPAMKYMTALLRRNEKAANINNDFVRVEFEKYNQDLLKRMWSYAQLSGMKEFCNK